MIVRLIIKNEGGKAISLNDGFPYSVGDFIILKEFPNVAFKVVERRIETGSNNKNIYVEEIIFPSITVNLICEKGYFIPTNIDFEPNEEN